jgi:hypothetical protein
MCKFETTRDESFEQKTEWKEKLMNQILYSHHIKNVTKYPCTATAAAATTTTQICCDGSGLEVDL